MRKVELIFLFVACMCIAFFLPNSVFALVDGPCSVCHTMHNSQGGESMEPGGGLEPFPHLTRGSCIGCHTGTNDGGVIPFVMSDAGEPNYGTDTLAGGNFYWVATDGDANDTKGHNVYGLSEVDEFLSKAPGGGGCGASACHNTLALKQIVMPELGSGCEGCHLAPAHHANDSDVVVGEDGGWFRYCGGHPGISIGKGVEGIEDDDWQYTNSASDHNEYLGAVGDPTASGGFGVGNTMTGYCTGCHGLFHVEQDGHAAWIRHPSDAVIPAEGEYAAYTVYDPLVPVARPDLDGWTAPSAIVTPSKDLVMCLSCHRAHGSPFPDLLRWDYNTQVAGGGGEDTGCFKCHSEKN